MLSAINMSGALDLEGLREAFPSCPVEAVDCRDIEGTACLCDDEAAAEIIRRTSGIPWRGIHWIDGGDYHYLTSLLCRKADEPFDLLLFDHHTDMQQPRYGEIISCGGWLRDMLLHNPMLRRGVIVGAAEELRCETEPFAERVAMQSSPEFEGDVPVYVSIDKDVLSEEDAATNWDQGAMRLPELIESLRLLSLRRRIIGADICGGLREPSLKNLRADISIIGTMLDIIQVTNQNQWRKAL